jgi:catechol 2,3-dioxygenase-like lactoylglutathione lyase family enzyme
MADRMTANLPARDMDETAAFYRRLGFNVVFKDRTWMILRRGALELEFFPFPDLVPPQSSFSACARVDELHLLYADFATAGLPSDQRLIPRLTAPKLEPFGLRMFALIDLNGSLVRCIENRPSA